jgi:hypothetical protein
VIEIACMVILLIIIVYQGAVIHQERKQHKENIQNEIKMLVAFGIEKEKQWTEERQQLLDRIQSPSFAEYKHQEVKVIKAKNNEKEPEKLEVL